MGAVGEQLSETTTPRASRELMSALSGSARNTLKGRTPGEENQESARPRKWLGYRLSIEPDHLPLTFA